MKRRIPNKITTTLILTFFLAQHTNFYAMAQENENSSLLLKDEPATQEAPKPIPSTINLVVGDVQIVETKNLARIAVTNPDTVDISDAKADKVFVVGKKPGTTEMFIWDDAGKRDITVRVATENLDNLKQRILEVVKKAQIKDVAIEKNEFEGKIMVSGSLSKADKDSLEKVIEPFSDRIINLVKNEVSQDLIQIDVQVTELSTSFSKKLGINWQTSKQTQDSTSGQYTAELNNKFQPTFVEALPSNPTGKAEDYFKLGKFFRADNSALAAQIDALVSEGKGKVLSKPRLVVLSGKEASFLVGGEVPIRTTTTNASGGQTQENVTFKQYGVNMTITPTLIGQKIDILLNVKISDIDKSTTNSSGDVGYTTRTAQTQLFLDDKQTIVLAGLIKHTEGETVSSVPFLSKLPLVGGLFRTRSNGNPDQDTELVLTLTPTILRSKKIETDQVAMPSKRLVDFKNQVEKNFEKEPIASKEKAKPANMEVKEPVKKTIEPVKAAEPKKEIVPVAKPKEMAPVNDDNQIREYVRSVQIKISKAISFPQEAITNQWQGTSTLRLRVLKDGSLAECDVLSSSGHDVIDRNAVSAAKAASPYGAFPASMQQEDVVITVPIIYNHTQTKDTQASTASY